MKTFLHYMRRYRLATFLNLLGIALTLAGLYILCIHIDYNRSYNHCIKDYETLYRLDFCNDEGHWYATLPRPMAEYLEKCPQIDGVAIFGWSNDWVLDNDGTAMDVPVTSEFGNAVALFGAERVDGVLETVAGENTAVIPASLATTLFGDKYAAGRVLKWVGGVPFTVAGVYEDFPANCSMENDVYVNMGEENREAHQNYSYHIFFRSKEDRESLKKIVGDAIYQYKLDLKGGADNVSKEAAEILATMKYVPVPVAETYFTAHDMTSDRGSLSALYMQEFAAALLLIVCIINFTNFSMGQAPVRIRSVLTRRVLGESLMNLRAGLLAEAAFVGVLAYALSLGIVWLVGKTPAASELLSVDITLGHHPVLLLLLLGTSICIGLLSAAYSTYYITSFSPVCAMKGNFALTPQGQKIRTWLVGLQICVSLVMAVFVGCIYSQSRYIYKSEYGYAKDSILTDNIAGAHQYSCSKATIRTELEQLPCVASVSFSVYNLGTADGFMGWGRGNSEVYYSFQALPVDWKFLRTYGIDIVEGRDFTEHDGDVYIINEAMKRAYPELQVGKPLYDGELTIVGICKDIRAFSTRVDNSQTPLAFVIFGPKYANWGDRCNTICIRLAPGVNIMDSRRQIAATLDKYAVGAKSDLVFLDHLMEQTYREELAFVGLMQLCSILTMIITLIGVFCLTMFETEYRRKEIAIRKVMGSSVSQVLGLFAGKYAVPLVAAFAVAVPVGYYFSTQWLQNFAEHVPVHWWLFPLAFLIVGAIVLLTVAVQSWRVATMNPFLSIKTE